MQKTLRRLVASAAILVVAGVIVGVSSTPAAALTSWSMSDNLENGAENRWSGGGVSGFGAVEYSGTAHSPTHEGWITAQDYGWGSLGRSIRVGVPAGSYAGCTSAIYVRPLSSRVVLNIEAINPTNWSYMGLKTVTITAPADGVYRPYQRVPGVSWTVFNRDVFFRVSILSESEARVSADLDDLSITCTSRN